MIQCVPERIETIRVKNNISSDYQGPLEFLLVNNMILHRSIEEISNDEFSKLLLGYTIGVIKSKDIEEYGIPKIFAERAISDITSTKINKTEIKNVYRFFIDNDFKTKVIDFFNKFKNDIIDPDIILVKEKKTIDEDINNIVKEIEANNDT